ncbi:hypothetical protein [Nocardia xishanensis]|uniref:hypothetical protein n=1 Tax=Nocardia xishanensis TaxID=238964 RepID=UPI00082A7723|nr:hypothetical protein [Nocardia xishanensis]
MASAIEWIASASIDEEPVIAYPMNSARAIPAYAPSAAKIAALPSLADIRPAYLDFTGRTAADTRPGHA